jgi:hypothetical protein
MLGGSPNRQRAGCKGISIALEVNMAYEWTANDWSNIVTISAAALASVLLVVFKSRCTQIRLCYGCWSCTRHVQNGSDDDEAPAPEPEQP